MRALVRMHGQSQPHNSHGSVRASGGEPNRGEFIEGLYKTHQGVA